MAAEAKSEGIIELSELKIPEGYDYGHQPETAWEHCCGICDGNPGRGGES